MKITSSPGESGRVPFYFWISIVFLVFTTVTTALRVAANLAKGKLRLEDYLSVFSWTFYAAAFGMIIRLFFDGVGRASPALDVSDVAYIMYISLVVTPLYVFAGMFARVSFALYLNNLLGPAHGTQKLLIYACIITQSITSIFLAGQILVRYGPYLPGVLRVENLDMFIPALWEKIVNLISALINLLDDLSLVAIALTLVHTLQQLNIRTRIGLACLLGISVLGVIAAILRVRSAVGVLETTVTNVDYSVYIGWLLFVAVLDAGCVLIAANIPPIRTLFPTQRVLPKLEADLGAAKNMRETKLCTTAVVV